MKYEAYEPPQGPPFFSTERLEAAGEGGPGMYYACAIFVLGAAAGLCAALFSFLPFIIGVGVGFALYELHPDGVRSLRQHALGRLQRALATLRELKVADFSTRFESVRSVEAEHDGAGQPPVERDT